MEAKTKTILLATYKKMYEAMKNSAEKKRIGKCLREPSKSHLLYHRIKFNIF